MNYSQCYAEYNAKRGQTNVGDVAIDSVSLGFDFCSIILLIGYVIINNIVNRG